MIYGFGRDHKVVFTQEEKLSGNDEVKQLAAELLKTFDGIEVWAGAICVFRRYHRGP